MAAIDSLVEKFASTGVEEKPKEISFFGKGLQMNTEKDADEIINAIDNCTGMVSLRLEGNTVGVPAAKVIGQALEKQPDFKFAYWKDMFTGRNKTEIPEALDYLSKGMITARARLVVLDLSDNAFGPRGLVGIKTLLESPCCYSLKELYLNNNGLGISGGQMLSEAILACIAKSKKSGTPMTLKIFECSRNRLENDGAIAISKFLKELGTLESVVMLQNGIYAEGIEALSNAFSNNPNLKTINLEDNTVTEAGAKCIAKCLPKLQQLNFLNLADCLLRTKGASVLAAALRNCCPNIVDINLGFNEIKVNGGLDVVEALAIKEKLQKLNLDGNQFGEGGCALIQEKMEQIGKFDYLHPFFEDEGAEEDDGDEDEDYGDEDDDDEYEDIDEEDEGSDSPEEIEVSKRISSQSKSFQSPMSKATTFADFLALPTSETLISLSRSSHDYTSALPKEPAVTDYLDLFFKISMAVSEENEASQVAACKFSDDILKKAFELSSDNLILFNNDLLVTLGLIKAEDKKNKKQGIDISGPLIVLSHAVRQPYFHSQTREALLFFLSQPLNYVKASTKSTHKVVQSLFKV